VNAPALRAVVVVADLVVVDAAGTLGAADVPVTAGAAAAAAVVEAVVRGRDWVVVVVRCRAVRRSSEDCAGRWAGVERVEGDSPVATDNGSEERPTRCPDSWLAAQASAAETAIPSTAATAVATDRLVIGGERYGAAG
jgi:hypothetical protein